MVTPTERISAELNKKEVDVTKCSLCKGELVLKPIGVEYVSDDSPFKDKFPTLSEVLTTCGDIHAVCSSCCLGHSIDRKDIVKWGISLSR